MAIAAATTPLSDVHDRTTSVPEYNESVIRAFTVATVLWAVFGLSAGVWVALLLAFPQLNVGEFFTFGRLRPVHTSGVILGFGGNALLATSLYVVQRTCQARLWGGRNLASLLFWSYQIVMVAAVISYPLGLTQSQEYAEPEWFLDILITLVWLLYLAIFVGTLVNRREPHIYVANWFFLAFIITVAVLHIVNNMAMPISWTSTKSYSFYSGVQSAMIQWWYGHNMVGFWLTAGFIGMMYYFVPKQAERPIYSYRLSIVHFWALVFLYIWVGPHHLHFTALPDWTQTLGAAFSIMLWIPSWGGMINGIMTLSGAWHKLRTDPIIRFLVVAVAFYGMSTFEGPLMALKPVNALSHYTDWTVGHVHSGALGWCALMAFGSLYHLAGKLWNRPLWSMKLVEVHFWLAAIGIVLYITAMWVSGITQGLMWKAYDDYGFLMYSFTDSVAMLHPYYVVRALGGIFFLAGAILFAINIFMTIYGAHEQKSADKRLSARPAPAE
ncbi:MULTISPECIES: cytochrome-c oxidase, cbb3-type subunit I [Hyphomicrobium]|uniref:cytochrome-c oxidase, cbb3-type subunit I n=1 Tax=Hyphomicrobium TaxID=81 RepID=UPI00156E32F5|nr:MULTISPECIES: cytochrome-c oxidase, cbb3-type subunit I [Hyphomicrobium]MBI1649369.1 cytochrome-c oxidase, cbb3-type subunit I [Hyphomicrobium sulfonivorans]MDH4982390.1 cytochrome-c oxidase, cbb3-type subunit I [Hyphomicrobium sp. D-2]NSL71287.1 cytochrome-c oxidase, cbb3-type subunit I [Hyphomicrobium sulfonivorans]